MQKIIGKLKTIIVTTKKNLNCLVTGHKMIIVQRFSDNFIKIKCEKCNNFFGVNHQLKSVLKWDKHFDSMVAVCYSTSYYCRKILKLGDRYGIHPDKCFINLNFDEQEKFQRATNIYELEKAKKENLNIVKCSYCNSPATFLDKHHPYEIDFTTCEIHVNESKKLDPNTENLEFYEKNKKSIDKIIEEFLDFYNKRPAKFHQAILVFKFQTLLGEIYKLKNKYELKRTESEQNLHVYISNQITVLETQIKVINKNSYHIDFLNGQILAFKTILSFLESENKDKEIFKEVVNLEIIKKSDLK